MTCSTCKYISPDRNGCLHPKNPLRKLSWVWAVKTEDGVCQEWKHFEERI